MWQNENPDLCALPAPRLGHAPPRREPIELANVEEDEGRYASSNIARLDQISTDVDALQDEIEFCTRELRAKRWARDRVQASLGCEQPLANGPDPDYRPGWLAKTVMRFIFGSVEERII